MKTVLIVEDDVDLRRMFRTALALAGYAVVESGDGLHALHLLDGSAPPDVVILDLGLPIISGAAVRQEIAAHAHTRHIPVIIVTGEPGDHERLQAACVLRKPVTPDKLLQVVTSCIAAGERGSAFV